MSTPDLGIFSAPRLYPEPHPAATSPARERLARPHCFCASPSHSIASFPSLLEILPRKSKTPLCVSFPSSWITLRNIYLSGLRIAHTWLGFSSLLGDNGFPLNTLLTETPCPGLYPLGSLAPWPSLCDFPHPSEFQFPLDSSLQPTADLVSPTSGWE